jgi:hypothetical protein
MNTALARGRLHPRMWQSSLVAPQLEQAEYERACLAGRCFPRPGDTAMLERCKHAYRMCHWIELFRRFHVSRLSDVRNTECRLKYLDCFLQVRPKDITRQVVIPWFHDIGRHSRSQANAST